MREIPDDLVARVAKAWETAEFGYRLELTRLVLGVSTYTLTYSDGTPPLEFGDIEDGYAHIAGKKRLAQARAAIEAVADYVATHDGGEALIRRFAPPSPASGRREA